MCKTMRINLFDLNKTTLFWIVLFLLGSYFYSAKVSAQTAITITGTSPNTFNITVPEGVSTRSVRLAGDLSDVVVYVQRTSDPAAERTLTIPSSNNTLIGGGGLSVATLDAVEEIADKVFHLKFALDSPAPAGDVWLIRVSKPSADTRTIYWMEGELNDAFGATYVSDVFAAPSPMEFDSVIVGDTKTLTITVHNRFAQDMTLAAALEYGDRGFSISSSVGSPVTGVSSTDIDISFNPVDESAKTDTLHLTTNDPDTPVLDVILNGTGTTRRIILALDYSGSMSCAYDEPWPCSDALESSRIAQARNALEPFLNDLEIGVSPGTSGAVRIGAVRFGGGSPAVEVEYGLNPINGSHINAMKGALGVPYSMGTGPSASGTTHISDALNQCLTLFGDSNEGAILLMSDGYAEPSGQDPRDTGVLTSIVDKGIPVFSIAFGENGAYVDHELMQDIQGQTNGEFVVFGAGSGESIPADLASVYTKVLDIAFGTETSGDPTVSVEPGGIKEIPLPVGTSDRRIDFVVSWERGAPNMFAVSIIAPDGTEITPDVARETDYVFNREGSFSSVYSVHKEYLRQPGKVGEWKLKVQHQTGENAVLRENGSEFSYSTLILSDLTMDVMFDKKQYFTGDSIRIEAKLTDRGKPVVGADVELNSAKPTVSIGNWFNSNTIDPGEFEILRKKYKLNDAGLRMHSQKAYILSEVKKIEPPLVVMNDTAQRFYDDGTHGDNAANDGIYTYVSSPLTKTGLHTFLIKANGKAAQDYNFQREKRLDHYIKLRPSVKDSNISVAYLETVEGLDYYQVHYQLMDQYKNLPRPDTARYFDFSSMNALNAVEPLQDNLDGTYTQKIKIPKNKEQTITLNFAGVEFTKKIVPQTTIQPLWWVILVIIAVIVIFIIRKLKTA